MKTRRIIALILLLVLIALLLNRRHAPPPEPAREASPSPESNTATGFVKRAETETPLQQTDLDAAAVASASIPNKTNATKNAASVEPASATNIPPANPAGGSAIGSGPRHGVPATPPVPLPARLTPNLTPVVVPGTNRSYTGP